MANVLTNIVPTLYRAANEISQEQTGALMAVSRDTDTMAAAAKDQTIRVPVAPEPVLGDVVPSMSLPAGDDQTIGYADVVMSYHKSVAIPWEGEQLKALSNGDMPMLGNITAQQLQQGMRTIRNFVDDVITEEYINASRAHGVAGTPPFGTALDFSDFAQMRRILEDNGTPTADLHMVLDSAAIANLRGVQSSLFKANEAGSSDLLRGGSLGQVEGFMIHNSPSIKTHVKGTAASATTDDTGYSVGTTEITLDATGSGTLVPGDVIAFTGDTNKYVVVEGTDDVSAGPTITIAEPGLMKALPEAAKAITVINDSARNMAFSRNAIKLVARPSAIPNPMGGTPGDAAVDEEIIVDPASGLPYRVAVYKGYHRTVTTISLLFGVATVKPRHFALLLG